MQKVFPPKVDKTKFAMVLLILFQLDHCVKSFATGTRVLHLSVTAEVNTDA